MSVCVCVLSWMSLREQVKQTFLRTSHSSCGKCRMNDTEVEQAGQEPEASSLSLPQLEEHLETAVWRQG